MMKRFAALAALGLGLMLALPAAAQMPTFVRGVVSAATPTQLTITTRDGKPVTVALAPTWSVVVMTPIAIDKIQPGSFIGTSEMPQPDGTGLSLEVHVFPPGVKMGEGHYPWDLQPGAMMTNGTVGTVTAVNGGRKLVVTYGTSSRTITVPANVPIVLITPGGDKSLIAPGAHVFLAATAGAGGALTTNSVSTGLNGAAPPM